MRLPLALLAALPVSFYANVALGAPEPSMTNGRRLAEGMTPSRPRKLFSPTEHIAARASPSALPPTGPSYPQYGYIYAALTDGTELGYLTTAADDGGILGQYSKYDRADVAQIVVNEPDSVSGYSDVQIVNSVYSSAPDLPYLGAIAGYNNVNGADVDGTVGDFVMMGYVKQTNPGAAPTDENDQARNSNSWNYINGEEQPYESNIWVVDADSGLMTPHWTNTIRYTEVLKLGEAYRLGGLDGYSDALVGTPNPNNFEQTKDSDFNALTLTFVTSAPPPPPPP